jgi:hypothetical protein
MTKRIVIWTEAARRLLYDQLVKRFGKLDSWPSQAGPTDRSAFTKFCNDFAKLVNAESGDAVKHQIAHAVGIHGDGTHLWEQSRFQTVVLNMASAYYAGFVTTKNFPTVIAAKHSVKQKEMTMQHVSETPAHKDEGSQAEFDRYIAGDR